MADEKTTTKPKRKRKPAAPKTKWVLLHTAVSGNYNAADGETIEMDVATADRFIAKAFATEVDKPDGEK